jgi:hypothetical protein
MVELSVQVHRIMLLEYPAQLRCDPLRKHARHSGPQPDDLDVRDPPQLGEDGIQLIVRQGKRVAAGEEDIPDLPVLPDVVQGFFNG